MWDGVRRGGDVAGDGDCPWRGGGARRLGRLTPLASGRGDVDRPACRGRSKVAGMDGSGARRRQGGFSKPPRGWKKGGGFDLCGKRRQV